MAWKPIPGFARYEASDSGRVRNMSGRELTPCKHRCGGYLDLMLVDDAGRRRKKKVHNLVLETFVGPRPSPRHQGAHAPDRNPENNRLENLSWKLPEENAIDKIAHGTAPKGGRVWRPSTDRVKRIRARVAAGESCTAIARDEGVHRHTVSRYARGLRRAKAA